MALALTLADQTHRQDKLSSSSLASVNKCTLATVILELLQRLHLIFRPPSRLSRQSIRQSEWI